MTRLIFATVLSAVFALGQPTTSVVPTKITATAAGTTTTTDPVDPALPVAKLGDLLMVTYVTVTADAWGAYRSGTTGSAMAPLQVTSVGFLCNTQKEWVTLARSREIRIDGSLWYGGLLSIPRTDLRNAAYCQANQGVTLP